MCGIVVGISNWMSELERTTVAGLMFHSTPRGRDSTGIVALQKDNGTNKQFLYWHKDTVQPVEFLRSEVTNNLLTAKDKTTSFIIGHNRSATVGTISKENAHPFMFEKLVGVHNGTVQKAGLKHASEYETDSEALLYGIGQDGLFETIDKANMEFGAYALAYYDRTTCKLCMIRNDARPLAIATHSSAVFAASEIDMLKWYIDRTFSSKFEFKNLPPHTLFEYSVGKEFDSTPKTTEFTMTKRKTYTNYSEYGGYYKAPDPQTAELWKVVITGPTGKSVTVYPFAKLMKHNAILPWQRDEPMFPRAGLRVSDYSKKKTETEKTATTETKSTVAFLPPPKNDPATDEKVLELQPDDPGIMCKNGDGKLFTVEQVETALLFACTGCEQYYDIDEVVDDDFNIKGLFFTENKKSEDPTGYICQACIRAENNSMFGGRLN